MDRLVYILFRFLVIWFKISPFFILYCLSDIAYFFIYYLIGYRKKVVYENLSSSFPEKSEQEIKKLMKAFYRHLCDISIETIKGFSMSEKQLRKRYKIENPEILDKYYEKNQSIICLASHYNNWEYGILALPLDFKHQAVSIYMKLSNKFMESYGTKKRSRFGMQMLAVQDTRSFFAETPKKPLAIVLAADQSPSDIKRLIWTKFLGKDTACLHGPEAYAKKMNAPLVYFAVKKLKRGFYSLNLEVLNENPLDTEFGEITAQYMHRLEKDILQQAEFWLWSHRRWKHNKEEIEKQKNYDKN
ncbi:MAG: hypothetical protein GX879_10590 [Bacteroidales bacterium]|nr:hypothetical protein [Bacteroidales bacterium]